MNNRLINTKVAGGGGGCTDIVDNYDPFGGNGVALYQLNGNANDVSGNYNGTATNVTYGTGVFGQAASFNGSSSYILANGLQSLYDNNQTSSISLWFKSTYSAAGQHIFIDYSGNINYSIFLNTNGTITSLTRGPGGDNTFTSVGTYNDGNWHHIVISKNNATLQKTIYIDNNLLVTQSFFGNAWSTTPQVSFGCLFVPPSTIVDPFNGSIDQVRIFNTALDPLEVEALYTEELCICDGTVDTLDILGDGSCIATYQLDGNANDLSGNYSGTPTDVSYGVGEFDLAGVFNGSSSKIVSNINVFNTTTYSVSLWVNVRNYKNAPYNHWAFIINNDQHLVLGEGPANTLKIYFSDFSTSNPFYTITDPTAWYHTVVTRTGNSISMYVNGSLANTFSYGGLSQGTVFKLGTNHTDNAFFDGSIDQVRVFNKALNSTEVTTLYNETACTVQPVPYSDYSALFNGTNEYMERTPSAASNRQVFTISVWFNTSSSGTRKSIISQGIDGNSFFQSEITNTGIIAVEHILGGGQIGLKTTATYDDGQWHNLVIAVNTNQSVASDRVKLYIDGNQVTSFSQQVYPSQGYNTLYNGTNKVTVGRISNCCLPYNGYLALVNSIDGLELDQTFFGEFNGSQWTPKGYAGSYGTNGFLLDFSNSSQLGEDLSGKNNNFSLVNMDSSNQFQNFNI